MRISSFRQYAAKREGLLLPDQSPTKGMTKLNPSSASNDRRRPWPKPPFASQSFTPTVPKVTDAVPRKFVAKVGPGNSKSPTALGTTPRFAEWMRLEEANLVDPAVINGYERAFQQQLESLIARTSDPALRWALEGMRQFQFCRYIVAAFVRHGLSEKYDTEDCLQRIVFRMLSSTGERGLPHSGLFDLEDRPYDLTRGNPLEARFKTFLMHDLRSILGNRIPALRKVQRPGSLSIAYGNQDSQTVSPDEIAGRPMNHDDELLNDVTALLAQRTTPEMPLVDLFQSILRGEGTRQQRTTFGYDRADRMRKMIVQIIGDYARQSQNWQLIRLLDRFRDFNANRPDPTRRPPPPPKPAKPKYLPDEADYRSIIAVIERCGRQANLAQLGHYRRRWLERKPRDPSSQFPNRLADVLARMVADGVLQKQGAKYIPGQNYKNFLAPPGAVSVS